MFTMVQTDLNKGVLNLPAVDMGGRVYARPNLFAFSGIAAAAIHVVFCILIKNCPYTRQGGVFSCAMRLRPRRKMAHSSFSRMARARPLMSLSGHPRRVNGSIRTVSQVRSSRRIGIHCPATNIFCKRRAERATLLGSDRQRRVVAICGVLDHGSPRCRGSGRRVFPLRGHCLCDAIRIRRSA